METAGPNLVITTEDGSLGSKGLVTFALEEMLKDRQGEKLQLFACGPSPMLGEVARMAKEGEFPLQVSLEAVMACGFGACRGCVCPRGDDGQGSGHLFKRVCTEGPVFYAGEVTLG